jgi:hypothetical protein
MTAQTTHARGYFLLALLTACSLDASGGSTTGESRSALEDGRLDAEDTGVVGLSARQKDNIVLCSGSLLAPNLVLTARHCVASSPPTVRCGETRFGPTYPGDSILVTEHPTYSTDLEAYTEGAETLVPPGGDDLCGFDVALVLLKSSISGERATPLQPRFDLAPQPNELYSAVGYGATCPSDDKACAGESGIRRRVDDLRVACALCPNPDFGTTEWLGDKDLCSGDSGSPALDAHGRVIGVASRAMDQSDRCIAPIYARVDSWRGFLSAAALDAARQGGYAPPAWASAPTATAVDPGSTAGGGCSLGASRHGRRLPSDGRLGGTLFALSFALFRMASGRGRRFSRR